MSRLPFNRQRRWQTIAAGFCLLALLSSLPWIRLGAVVLVALADPAHSVGVAARDQNLTVVLRHQQAAVPARAGSFGPRVEHHHGAAANLLMLLADDASSRADHVLRIEAAGAPAILTPLPTAAPELVAHPLPAPARVAADRWGADPLPSPRTRPPPGASLLLAHLRATVLLI